MRLYVKVNLTFLFTNKERKINRYIYRFSITLSVEMVIVYSNQKHKREETIVIHRCTKFLNIDNKKVTILTE